MAQSSIKPRGHRETSHKVVVESAYFHTGNSGLTIELTEIENDRRDPPTFNYRLDVSHGAFGSHTDVSVPLGNLHVAQWLEEALGRLRVRMNERGFTHEYAFETSRRSSADSHIRVIGGLRREEVWEERVTDRYSTSSRVVAYRYWDGAVLAYEQAVTAAEAREIGETGSGCGGSTGSDARFEESDIGKIVVHGRVQKDSERRVFHVDLEDMHPEQVATHITSVKKKVLTGKLLPKSEHLAKGPPPSRKR